MEKGEGDELIEKFYEAAAQHNFSESTGWVLDHKQTMINARQCAIIAVEREIELLDQLFYVYGLGFIGKAEARNDITKWKRYENATHVLNYLKSKL